MFQGNQGNSITSKTKKDSKVSSDFDIEGDISTNKTNINKESKKIPTMPKGHEKYSEADKEKCPYFQFGQNEKSNTNTADTTAASETKGEKKKEGKIKKPKGGCPFMTSETKKPPALAHYTSAYEIPYISQLKYLLNFRGLLSKNENNEGRETFESYPIFLKHSLFHKEEQMKKIRALEVAQRFFIYDKFREKGNKCYNKGNFEESIGLFEHALSCFKWLEFKEPEKKKKKGKKKRAAKKIDEIIESEEGEHKDIDQETDNNGEEDLLKEEKKDGDEEIKIEDEGGEGDGDGEENGDEEEGGEEEEELDPLAGLKPLNKALVSIITDDNIVLHDGEEVKDSCEKDMRQSMLMNIYLSLACCYINLYHYATALEAIEEGFKITQGSSQLYFRRSQARAYNKGSTMEQLLLAKADIEKAIEIKHYEKLFQAEPNMLKLLNLHNAGEIYVEHAHLVEKLIKEKKEAETNAIKAIFERCKELEFIEETLIKEGKIPREEDESNHSIEINQKDGEKEEDMEFDVVKEMITKYLKVIEFYQETDKKDQVQIARKEIQDVFEIYYQMKFYLKYDFTTPNNEIVQTVNKEFNLDITKPKTLRRLNRLMINKAKDLFESNNFHNQIKVYLKNQLFEDAHFNLEVFQYAVKDYFKRKQEKEEKRLKKEKEKEEAERAAKPWTQRVFGNMFKGELAIQLSIILAILFGFYYYTTSVSHNVFWK